MALSLLGFFQRPKPPPSALRVENATTLLIPHKQVLDTIYGLSRANKETWLAFYQPLIEQFAELVQHLPASESQHHCEPGGMLTHTLDVMRRALQARSRLSLPEGMDPQDQGDEADLWTWAIASAALLHDAAKPLVDQQVMLYNDKVSPLNEWCAWEHTMLSQGGHWCVTRYRQGRHYHRHEHAALLIAQRLMPPKGMRWLTSSPTAFDDWLAALSGRQQTNVIVDIVKEADKSSAISGLGGSPAVAQAARPLSTRLLTAMREIATTSQVNRPGSVIFVFDNNDAWVISQRILQMAREKVQSSGFKVPGNNIRLMEELTQNQVVTPTTEGKAIWNVAITLGEWQQDFRVMRVPLASLYPDHLPEPADGSIEIIKSPQMAESDEGEAQSAVKANVAPSDTSSPIDTSNEYHNAPSPPPNLITDPPCQASCPPP